MLIYWITSQGSMLESNPRVMLETADKMAWQELLSNVQLNQAQPLAILLVQIIVILLVARFFGWLCKKIRQPTVIGEIIGGIILGPSFLNLYFPTTAATLFPPHSLNNLELLSQVGLLFFMFIIGMQLELTVLRRKVHSAFVISHASIIFPFALGVCLAYYIYEYLAPSGIDFVSFALFIGISMSITAFPVLARIVHERNLHKTKLGALVITCAAVDDVTTWCVLATVIAVAKAGSFLSAVYIIVLAVAFVLFMVKLVKPFLTRIGDMYVSREHLSKSVVAIFFLTLIICAYLSEVIGIHALFGAFMAGAIMPENKRFRNIFSEKIEDIALVLLLPLFFVYTGLRTQISLLNDVYLWQVTFLIILIAVVGKFMGSTLAARLVGQNWKDSLTIGALMNTRGLMELVVLNIGYDLGILTVEIFTMMVIMALVTTLMTAPTLDLIEHLFKNKRSNIPIEVSRFGKYNILLAFSHPQHSTSLLRLAHSLIKKLNRSTSITALHLTASNDLHLYNAAQYEADCFAPIKHEAKQIEQEMATIFKASNNIERDITQIANSNDYDLLLIGAGKSIFEGSALGKIFAITDRIIDPEKIIQHVREKENPLENPVFSGTTQQLLHGSHIAVGVFFNNNFKQADRILLPVFTNHDLKLIHYAQKFIHNSNAQIVIVDTQKLISQSMETLELIRAIEHVAPNHISRLENTDFNEDLLANQDLIIVSAESWKYFFEAKKRWVKNIPSTLLVRHR
ncbi:Na+/H+-exchanging protein [Sphingobacterium deserti]|uniref:Na+/H+-exchanging protein n=1 Tax=Sphingobacterium deserti TaxID=1229276 RepID=A0A0B8T3B6_9SPHI|nr:Na+/H+-exchanging protein [Sphingobacterium deserti]